MNPSPLSSPLRLLALACSTITLASAQSQDDPFGARQPQPQPKLTSFELSANLLRDSVELLQRQLAKEKMDPVNVVLDPGAGELPVPDLRFGAVTGHDALKLLAAAAGCDAQPILSDESEASRRIIGYKLRPSEPLATSSASLRGGYSSAAAGPSTAVATARPPSIRPSSIPAEDVLLQRPIAHQNTATVVGGAQHPAQPVSQVRVYALGTIVPATSDADAIQKLVHSVLETSAISKEEVRLMVHEKSNVLVVRAPGEVQELVEQVLQSLTKNSAHIQETKAQNQAASLERELSARAAQNDILQERLSAQAEEIATLRQELSRLQGQRAAEKPGEN